ncbi:ATP-binding protein [Georgenia thermotolerans]|uniref:histidine kinase n=1 Tax=Georgenia thermotolerans TaxID=527326 RepID=A0A7J5UQT3_9MICO|nr:ATP-binding protein [Georgenia thermotolerans]KAE8764677.1 HAMP domain-containing protein [Georgenia thermotolerans]
MRKKGLGIRAVITLAATAVVAVILVVAGVALTMLLRHALMTGIEAAARERADYVASLVDTPLPTSAVDAVSEGRAVAQVLDQEGHVVVASHDLEGEPAMRSPVTTPQVSTIAAMPSEDDEPYRVVALPAGPPEAPRTVLVALPLTPVVRVVGETSRLILAIFPAVLALTGLVTWLAVGHALAPVERIRRKAATIGAGDLSQRVPLPPAHDELRRLAETMNSMLSRIEAAHERQRHFVSDASHELRSPLANEQALVEVALARRDLDLWQEVGQDLQAEQARMRRLVDDLLLLARLDGQVPVPRREVDLDDVVHEQAARLRKLGRVRMEVAPLPALRVLGDVDQLGRVVRNLLDNAARHARTTVTVALRTAGGEAVLRVTDDGAGVPPDQRERIFDRFTRLDEARGRDQGGSGLGLAISRAIAAAHGGSLVLAEPAGPGAAFELRLPLLPDVPEGAREVAPPETTKAPGRASARRGP